MKNFPPTPCYNPRMSNEQNKPWPLAARIAFFDAARICREKAAIVANHGGLSEDERKEGVEALERMACEYELKGRPTDHPHGPRMAL